MMQELRNVVTNMNTEKGDETVTIMISPSPIQSRKGPSLSKGRASLAEMWSPSLPCRRGFRRSKKKGCSG